MGMRVLAAVLLEIAAADLAAENRVRLGRILESLRSGGEERLCAPPFPKTRRRVRWLHIPKCSSSFGNTVVHHGCAALDEGLYYLGAPSAGTAVAGEEDVGPALTMPALARAAQRTCRRDHAFALDGPSGAVHGRHALSTPGQP